MNGEILVVEVSPKRFYMAQDRVRTFYRAELFDGSSFGKNSSYKTFLCRVPDPEKLIGERDLIRKELDDETFDIYYPDSPS